MKLVVKVNPNLTLALAIGSLATLIGVVLNLRRMVTSQFDLGGIIKIASGLALFLCDHYHHSNNKTR
jgi:hypothetical protein